MRRTKEDTEKTRNELLTVAVKVFNENGYSNTRLEDVAKAAGVTRGAIYYHFGSKAEIFKEIVLANKNQTRDLMKSELENFHGTMLEGIQKVFKKYLTRVETDDYFRDVETLLFKTELSGELGDIVNTFKLHANEGYLQLIKLIEKGKKDKSIRGDLDSKTFAFSVMSYLYGIMSVWIFNSSLISIKKKADQLSDFIFQSCIPE